MNAGKHTPTWLLIQTVLANIKNTAGLRKVRWRGKMKGVSFYLNMPAHINGSV